MGVHPTTKTCIVLLLLCFLCCVCYIFQTVTTDPGAGTDVRRAGRCAEWLPPGGDDGDKKDGKCWVQTTWAGCSHFRGRVLLVRRCGALLSTAYWCYVCMSRYGMSKCVRERRARRRVWGTDLFCGKPRVSMYDMVFLYILLPIAILIADLYSRWRIAVWSSMWCVLNNVPNITDMSTAVKYHSWQEYFWLERQYPTYDTALKVELKVGLEDSNSILHMCDMYTMGVCGGSSGLPRMVWSTHITFHTTSVCCCLFESSLYYRLYNYALKVEHEFSSFLHMCDMFTIGVCGGSSRISCMGWSTLSTYHNTSVCRCLLESSLYYLICDCAFKVEHEFSSNDSRHWLSLCDRNMGVCTYLNNPMFLCHLRSGLYVECCVDICFYCTHLIFMLCFYHLQPSMFCGRWGIACCCLTMHGQRRVSNLMSSPLTSHHDHTTASHQGPCQILASIHTKDWRVPSLQPRCLGLNDIISEVRSNPTGIYGPSIFKIILVYSVGLDLRLCVRDNFIVECDSINEVSDYCLCIDGEATDYCCIPCITGGCATRCQVFFINIVYDVCQDLVRGACAPRSIWNLLPKSWLLQLKIISG